MAIFRGNTVFFDVQFIDQTQTVVGVDTATLTIMYPDGDSTTEEAVTLTEGDEDHWTGQWASKVSDGGWVHWCAYGILNSPAKEFTGGGKIKIVTNPAAEEVFEDA